ncbi:TIGR01777 family oxidoreductase [candidate division KSB1 bacterium]|nr:TIGR01777 family oxidoreductase [candidate division KSB1 bacterium]
MNQKKIVISGGTGFIGKTLTQRLIENGFKVVILTRRPELAKTDEILVKPVKWDGRTVTEWADEIENATAIINLAGAGIAGGVWTKKYKKLILQSRIDAGQAIVSAVQRAKNPPEVIIQPSGIGYYGSRGDEILSETATAGSGFLSDIAQKWETCIDGVTEKSVRLIKLRIGLVLGKGGGFLSLVKLPFYFFIGGHLGSGEQWLSWIHLEDLVNAIIYLVENKNNKGVFNLSSPRPEKARDFFKILGEVMHRPSWLRVPEFVLRLLLGEMAQELLLSSQRVTPERLLNSDFQFKFGELQFALQNILPN